MLWAGSDDGRVHLTRNGGESWEEVTPPGLPELSAIYEIEISPHDPATVYLAITRYRKADDYSPYLLKTNDYGKTWERLDGTFPKDEITRTIREDTERQGMLFVGTETGVFVSIDDGKEWRPLNLNMPPVPVHDIEVKGTDLVIATHGRGFWILDDISPLRQYTPDLAGKTAHLFKPGDHTRFGYNWWIDYGGGPASEEKYFFVRNAEAGYTFYERGTVNGERKRDFIDAGEARPLGVILYYLLSDQAKEVSLSILDEQGNEIRSFGSDEIPTQQFSNIKGREYSGGLIQGSPRPASAWDSTASSGTCATQPFRPFPESRRWSSTPSPNPAPTRFGSSSTVNPRSSPSSSRSTPTRLQPRRNRRQGGFLDGALCQGRGRRSVRPQGQDGPGGSGDCHKAGGTEDFKAQGAVVDQLCQDYIASMVATGTTLVQVISEPTKPLSKLVTLHNIMEHTEGPPNQPLLEVYAKVTAEMDDSRANFEAALEKEMALFESLTNK